MELSLGFTDKQITLWAGTVLLKRKLDHIGCLSFCGSDVLAPMRPPRHCTD